MAAQRKTQMPRPEAATTLKIFDCDVHPVPKAGLESLKPYLPKPWQERFARKRAIHDGLNVPIRFRHPNGSVVRQDARTPEGGPSASNPEYLVRDLRHSRDRWGGTELLRRWRPSIRSVEH